MVWFAARVSLGLCAFWDYLEHMTRVANDSTVLNETRLRAALTANLEFRIWNDARVGDAVVQVRASGACALPRIRSMLESADLVVLGGRCARVA
jgi:hypothetical protein